MGFSQKILQRCLELQERGLLPALCSGQTVTRKFADLGCEEFYLLPNGKLLSLCTGKQSDFPPEERQRFALVPSCDWLITELSRRAVSIAQLKYIDQRHWQLTLIKQGQELSFCGDDLQSVLIEGVYGVI